MLSEFTKNATTMFMYNPKLDATTRANLTAFLKDDICLMGNYKT